MGTEAAKKKAHLVGLLLDLALANHTQHIASSHPLPLLLPNKSSKVISNAFEYVKVLPPDLPSAS